MASSGLTCVSLPEMPAGMVGEVSSGIQSVRSSIAGELSEIREAAVELTRRALWAEIADKLASGAELSDSQLREFNAWLMDGSMLRYANSYQAGLAGDFVGATYRDTFRNPEDLIELAQILRGSQQNSAGEELEAFSAGFVESFGAENMVAVPRVIQAMEWSNVISSGLSLPTDPRVLQDVAQEWFRRQRARARPRRAICWRRSRSRSRMPPTAGGSRARPRRRSRSRRHLVDRAARPHGPLRDAVPARRLREGRRPEDLRRLALQPDRRLRAAARRLLHARHVRRRRRLAVRHEGARPRRARAQSGGRGRRAHDRPERRQGVGRLRAGARRHEPDPAALRLRRLRRRRSRLRAGVRGRRRRAARRPRRRRRRSIARTGSRSTSSTASSTARTTSTASPTGSPETSATTISRRCTSARPRSSRRPRRRRRRLLDSRRPPHPPLPPGGRRPARGDHGPRGRRAGVPREAAALPGRHDPRRHTGRAGRRRLQLGARAGRSTSC